jgi:hypothetical protein
MEKHVGVLFLGWAKNGDGLLPAAGGRMIPI